MYRLVQVLLLIILQIITVIYLEVSSILTLLAYFLIEDEEKGSHPVVEEQLIIDSYEEVMG